MAHQLLRRPGLGCRGPAAPRCLAQVPVLRRLYVRLPVAVQPSLSLQPPAVNSRLAPCRAAADTEVADANERPRSRLMIDTSPEIIDGPDAPDLPMPSEYQQTLWSSFTLAGIGLHTGEYACVRVRPAFAGEGRYFVRVPEGTNAARAAAGADMETDLQGELQEEMATEEALLSDPEYRQELVARYQEYIDAQEDEGFGGSFVDYLNANEFTDLVQRLEEEGPPKFSFSAPEAPQPRSEDELYVPASAAFICEANPITTTLARDNFQVAGVESLLSALEACGVDNARIEIEGGPEVPVLDGSAEGWTLEVCQAGLRYAPARPDLPVKLPPGASGQGALSPTAAAAAALGEYEEGEEGEYEEVSGSGRRRRGAAAEYDEEEAEEREDGAAARGAGQAGAGPVPKLVLRPQSVVSVHRGSSFVAFYPEDTFRLTAGIDRHREAPVIGKQWLSWCMWEDVHYRHALSDARLWVASPEQAMGMREAGWLMGGTEGVMLIGFEDRWYDPEIVRHDDEPVRRQLQDLIGDLSLLSRDGHSGLPCGHIVSYDADHELNAAFVEKLLESVSEEDWVPIANVTGPSVTTDMRELMSSVIADREGEGEEGEAGEGDEDEEEGDEDEEYGGEEREMYGEQEYDEGEDEEDGEDGGYDDEGEDEGVVDVEATEVDPRKGRGGGKGGRR